MRKRPLFLYACVFLTGLVYCKYNRVECLVVLVVWLCYEVFCGIRRMRIKLAAGRSFLLLSVFILGNMHMQTQLEYRDAYLSKMKDGKEITVWGEITKIETTSTGNPRLILSECFVSLEGEALPCNDVMVYPSSNQYQVGEIHKMTGQLNLFEQARNEGGFDSRSFYQSQKIDFCLYLEKSQLLEKPAQGIGGALLWLRGELADVYNHSTSEKTAGFLTGMLLGDRSGLEADLKTLFTNGGIAHVLAISGLHVSIIGRGFYGGVRKRGISFAVAGMLAGMLLLMYGYMVGNGMSAVRAIGMMLLFFLAQVLGRSYDMLNSLGAMGVFLLWDNPFLVEYSGFWFSISALIGVGFVGATLSQMVEKGKGLLMSVGITLATLPIVAYCYYEIPLYSPLVNTILLPLLSPIFILALVGGCVGLIFPWMGTIILAPCEWGLGFYEWICRLVEKLPFSMIITGIPSTKVIVIYYVVLGCGTVLLQKYIGRRLECATNTDKTDTIYQTLRRKEMTIAMAMICVCCGMLIFPRCHEEEITFLDVGQGDGIYMSTGDGVNYFIDGGSTNEKKVGQYVILPFLKSNQIRKIDYWFVTHADTDHISGLLEVIESGYCIKHLVVAEASPEDENKLKLLAKSQEQGIEIIYMKQGDSLVTESTTLTCLYPSTAIAEEHSKLLEDRNEASLVLEYLSREFGEYKEFRGIFTGDISKEAEEVLLEQGVLQDVNLYKVGHHGSRYSSSEKFLAVIQPELAVVSCGRNNRYGHPAEETIERMLEAGTEIFYTMKSGQISLQMKGGRIKVHEYQEE